MNYTQDQMHRELRSLEQEHRDLNEIIDDSNSITKFSEFTLQKLKKRKLFLKDKIKLLQSMLYPDIIA
jgi:hypothetical protein